MTCKPCRSCRFGAPSLPESRFRAHRNRCEYWIRRRSPFCPSSGPASDSAGGGKAVDALCAWPILISRAGDDHHSARAPLAPIPPKARRSGGQRSTRVSASRRSRCWPSLDDLSDDSKRARPTGGRPGALRIGGRPTARERPARARRRFRFRRQPHLLRPPLHQRPRHPHSALSPLPAVPVRTRQVRPVLFLACRPGCSRPGRWRRRGGEAAGRDAVRLSSWPSPRPRASRLAAPLLEPCQLTTIPPPALLPWRRRADPPDPTPTVRALSSSLAREAAGSRRRSRGKLTVPAFALLPALAPIACSLHPFASTLPADPPAHPPKNVRQQQGRHDPLDGGQPRRAREEHAHRRCVRSLLPLALALSAKRRYEPAGRQPPGPVQPDGRRKGQQRAAGAQRV